MNLDRNARALAIAAWFLPLLVSCASLRNGAEDDGVGSSKPLPRKLADEGITKVDYNKKFDKKSLDIHQSYSDAPEKGSERSSFQSQRFTEFKPIESSRFNTERYNAESAQKQTKKKWYQFSGDRDKKQKSSRFGKKRSAAESDVYSTRGFPDQSNIESIYGTRSERDISSRYFSNELPGQGTPSPTVIREKTMSEGDIRALLNGP